MSKKDKRPSWEEYALELAKVASKRSEDPYLKVGASVLRYDNSVAGLGYNGAPPNIEIDWDEMELTIDDKKGASDIALGDKN